MLPIRGCSNGALSDNQVHCHRNSWGIGTGVAAGVGGMWTLSVPTTSVNPWGLVQLHQPTLTMAMRAQLTRENRMLTASLYLIILITLITIVILWATFNLNAELMKSYPAEWEQLGRPTLLSQKTIRQELRLMSFIALRKYRKFQDPRLSRFGDLVFVCTCANIALCILWGFLPHRSGAFFY
jgi:hypothetical protein